MPDSFDAHRRCGPWSEHIVFAHGGDQPGPAVGRQLDHLWSGNGKSECSRFCDHQPVVQQRWSAKLLQCVSADDFPGHRDWSGRTAAKYARIKNIVKSTDVPGNSGQTVEFLQSLNREQLSGQQKMNGWKQRSSRSSWPIGCRRHAPDYGPDSRETPTTLEMYGIDETTNRRLWSPMS